MIDFLERAKRVLWLFVEFVFVALIAIILIYLILGPSSGVFVQSVADNVIKFAGEIQTPSLIGLALVGLLVYLIAQRAR